MSQGWCKSLKVCWSGTKLLYIGLGFFSFVSLDGLNEEPWSFYVRVGEFSISTLELCH